MLTEIQRKRKCDICESLGKSFKPYAKSDSSKDYLFDEKTMKKMNKDLETTHDKYRSKNFYQPSENWGGSYLTQKSRSQGQKQPILKPMEKVLIGVRGTFQIYGINIPELEKCVNKFHGGNISSQILNWKRTTKDKVLLDIIQHGLKLRIVDKPVTNAPFEHPRSIDETAIINGEIQKLLRKQVIEEVANDTNTGYYSNLFTNRKKDGTYRTILNLKKINEYCTTEHFKMESIKNVINMLKPGMFLASIDIKDAFYSVLIFPGHRKYLRFIWKEKIYQFLAMPNGYIDVMRISNKLLKPVFASLHELGYESSVYVDDSLLLAQTCQECFDNVLATVYLLQELGFVIHPTKSIFVPTQKIFRL